MIFEPASSCMTSPEVTIGLMPSSMQVPLHINAHVSMIGSYLAFKLDFKTAVSKAARDKSVTIGAAQKHKQQDRMHKCFGGGYVCCRTISSMQTSPKLLSLFAPIGGHDNPRPEEWILGRIGLDPIEG